LDVSQQARPDPDLGSRREGKRVNEDIEREPCADQHFGPFSKDQLTGW
jgi:hypothetical protein